MPLRTRLTLVVVAAVCGLWAVFGWVYWQRDRELTARYHGTLLHAQAIAWNKLLGEAEAALRAAQAELLARPDWALGVASANRDAQAEALRAVVGARSGWRADLYDARRLLTYTSSTAAQPEPMADASWLSRALASGTAQVAVAQTSSDRFHLVALRAFPENGPVQGVLALGVDLAPLLRPLADTMDGDAFLLNLRGRRVDGTAAQIPAADRLETGTRQARVAQARDDGGATWLGVVQPLQGFHGRPVGALLVARNVSEQRSADRRAAWLVLGAGVGLLGVMGVAVFVYLGRAMQPLERAVGVLDALSWGDLRAAPDEDDQALPDEAGQIARGVAALRTEMFNLQMLRDERTRIRQQQERLIRRQLKHLAESLDEASRAEVLAALEPEAGRAAENELAELARILGQMSGLVTTQQDRLIRLLRELQAAMAQQALLVSLQQELEIARNMQLSILPRSAPDTPNAQVASLMIPAKEVGGDFYDYFLIDDDHLALVVADVSGKGIPAAFFMAISRTLAKSNALFLRDPAQVIARLNDQLCAENEQMMFVTLFFGVLQLSTGRLDYVNAGHNPPVLVRSGVEPSLLPSRRNMALAVMEGQTYGASSVDLGAQDLLLLYTDGVTEATDASGALFGDARLLDAVARAPRVPAEMTSAVLAAVRAFENGAAQADDITCVALRWGAQP